MPTSNKDTLRAKPRRRQTVDALMASRAACRLLAAALLAAGARANCRGLDRAALITLYEALGCNPRSVPAPAAMIPSAAPRREPASRRGARCARRGAEWTNNKNWNTTTGTPEQNKNNDPCDPNKRWYGVGYQDPCLQYHDDILGSGPVRHPNPRQRPRPSRARRTRRQSRGPPCDVEQETDYLTEIRGAGQGCFAGRISSLNLHRNNLVGMHRVVHAP